MRSRTIYTCDTCGGEYNKKEHYERHVRVHTRERPFACPHCPAKFPRRDTLRRHRRARHARASSDTTPPAQSNVSLTGDDQGPITSVTPIQDQPVIVEPASHVAVSPKTAGNNSQPSHQPWPVSFENFDWQWDTTLDLDASYSVEDLQIYTQENETIGQSWLPLSQSRPELYQPTTQPTQSQRDRGLTSLATPLTVPPDTQVSPDGTPSSGVDETSRGMLSLSLAQRVPETTLPSTTFLNRCIYMYTTRVWPIVPIVHLPTFVPARTHPLLLLTICAVGALADGSETAYAHAVRMFESVRKAILVSFSLEFASHDDIFAVLQAGAMGQTCAILSGRSEFFRVARAFHGAMSGLSREYEQASAQSGGPPFSDAHDCNLSINSSAEWRWWIREQSAARLHNAIQIHNGELAATLHEPAQIRTQANRIHAADPDNIFLAKNVDEWSKLRALRATPDRRPIAVFSCCAELERIIAEIGHRRFSSIASANAGDRQEIAVLLIQWLEGRRESLLQERSHRLSPMILWHSGFLLLDCDLETMEQRFSEGPGDSASLALTAHATMSNNSLQEWADSDAAGFAIRHAILIMRSLEHLRINEPTAIHVARCAWHAGLVLAAYSAFAPGQGNISPHSASAETRHSPELLSAWRSGLFSELDWIVAGQPCGRESCRTMAYSLCSTLRSLGTWAGAARFAQKLDKVLEIAEACSDPQKRSKFSEI